MCSKRFVPQIGKDYILHSVGSYYTRFTCLSPAPVDQYSSYNAVLQNIWSGWTFTAHGVNLYEDGTIDWDFSTDGHF